MKKNDDRCDHIFRSGPLLQNIRIGGGVSLGQCEKDRLPLMTVCEYHADPQAVRMAMRDLERDRDRYRSLVERVALASRALDATTNKTLQARLFGGPLAARDMHAAIDACCGALEVCEIRTCTREK